MARRELGRANSKRTETNKRGMGAWREPITEARSGVYEKKRKKKRKEKRERERRIAMLREIFAALEKAALRRAARGPARVRRHDEEATYVENGDPLLQF